MSELSEIHDPQKHEFESEGKDSCFYCGHTKKFHQKKETSLMEDALVLKVLGLELKLEAAEKVCIAIQNLSAGTGSQESVDNSLALWRKSKGEK